MNSGNYGTYTALELEGSETDSLMGTSKPAKGSKWFEFFSFNPDPLTKLKAGETDKFKNISPSEIAKAGRIKDDRHQVFIARAEAEKAGSAALERKELSAKETLSKLFLGHANGVAKDELLGLYFGDNEPPPRPQTSAIRKVF